MPLTTMEELHVPDKGGGPSVPDKRGVVPRILGKGVFPLVHDPGGEEKEEKRISFSYKCNVFELKCSYVHGRPEDSTFCQIKMKILKLM